MKSVTTTWNRIRCGPRYFFDASATKNKENIRAIVNKTSRICTKSKGILTLTLIGFLTFGFGLTIFFVQPYDILFNWKCVFGPGGEIFELWRKPPVDLFLKVYLFNVTNKEAFLEGREKLKVQEVGPYVYRELLIHENITFNNNGTLSAIPSHPLEWAPDLSEGRSEDDQLILPHIALLAISHVIAEKSYFTQFGLNLVIRQSNSYPLVQMSAKEFMFGYKSSLLTLGNQFMSEWISFDKLGLIDRMYDFQGDFETIYTGERDVMETGLFDTYRGSTQLPYWEGPCANIRNASDGTKFRGHLNPDDKLLFYRKSLCRPSTLVRVNTTTASGLDGYYYTFEEFFHYNDTSDECYCKNGQCPTPGIIDVTDCYYGFPIGVSLPHFLYGDQSLLDAIEGSNPDPVRHGSYFIIEPSSGLPLKVAARYQINMVLGNMDSIAHVERFSNMVLPMLWTEIAMAELPRNLKIRFNIYLYILPILQSSAPYVLFIVSIILVLIALHKHLQRTKALAQLFEPNWMTSYCLEEDVNRKLSTVASYTEIFTSTPKNLDVYSDSDSSMTLLNHGVVTTDYEHLKAIV